MEPWEPLEGPALAFFILMVVYTLYYAIKYRNLHLCRKCGFTFNLDELNQVCPFCGSEDIAPTNFPGRFRILVDNLP
jgi:hypothetical protein